MKEWLRKMFGEEAASRPVDPKGPAQKVDILSAAERDGIVAAHLVRHLPAVGLSQVTPRNWVDGSAPPARRVFQLALLKGASMKINWGFSLDFVPHISGLNLDVSARRLCWHRSDKTAILDVIIDPPELQEFCFLFGADALHRQLEQYLPGAVERAQGTWRRGSTWQGMLGIVQEIRERKINGFAFDNYSQLPLAYVFLCAKTGNLAAAEAELATIVRRHNLGDALAEKLVKLARDLAPAASSLTG